MKEKKNNVKSEEPKQKTKKQLMEEQKLQAQQERKLYEIRIKNILSELDKLSKDYPIKDFEIAVGRWKTDKQQRRAAEKAIADAEARLAETKRRYGR